MSVGRLIKRDVTKTSSHSVWLSADVRAAVIAAAEARGVSISEEIATRVSQSFDREAIVRDLAKVLMPTQRYLPAGECINLDRPPIDFGKRLGHGQWDTHADGALVGWNERNP